MLPLEQALTEVLGQDVQLRVEPTGAISIVRFGAHSRSDLMVAQGGSALVVSLRLLAPAIVGDAHELLRLINLLNATWLDGGCVFVDPILGWVMFEQSIPMASSPSSAGLQAALAAARVADTCCPAIRAVLASGCDAEAALLSLWDDEPSTRDEREPPPRLRIVS